MYECIKLFCDVRSYSGPDWSTSLFDTSNSVIWHTKTQTAFHSMRNPGWEWNDETAQQVSERNWFWLCFTGNGDTRQCQQNNFLVCVCVWVCVCNLYLTRQGQFKNKFLFTMTVYPGQTRTTLGQLCAALWDSQSQPDVIQPGFESGTVVTPLVLRSSALDLCIHVCVLTI
jgi:hypothetical protein